MNKNTHKSVTNHRMQERDCLDDVV